VEAYELAPDLWRWTGRRSNPDIEVGCVYYKTGSDILLFDPLLPAEDPEGFWRALDRDVNSGDHVHVLVTRPSHTRSSPEMADRYQGGSIWSRGAAPPAGVEALPSGRDDEVLFWIQEHRALVIGDAIVGDGEGRLRLSRPELAPALQPLLGLDVEFVLVSHGEPARGGAALCEALAV
jgi:hypothetical protein